MSNYRVSAVDGKLIYKGDGPLYFSNPSSSLEKIYKATKNYGPNNDDKNSFYNDFNGRKEDRVAFPIEIKTGKPLSIGFYVMQHAGGSLMDITQYEAFPMIAVGSNYKFGLFLSYDTTRAKAGCVLASPKSTIVSDVTTVNTRWYHLTLTKDENDIWYFFVNGKLKGSKTDSVALSTPVNLGLLPSGYYSDNMFMQDVFVTDNCIATNDFNLDDVTNLLPIIKKRSIYNLYLYN